METYGFQELRCCIQTNIWGKYGTDSMAASLRASADPEFVIDPKQTYAELWIGTHPNNPTIVKATHSTAEVSLQEWLQRHPEQLGTAVHEKFGANLPFLLKVISARHVLSLQAHPDEELARTLHQSNPAMYKNDVHKPELLVALSPYVGLNGFRSVTEVAAFLRKLPELRSVLLESGPKVMDTVEKGEQDGESQGRLMKECFRELLTQSEKVVSQAVISLVNRLRGLESSGEDITSVEGDVLLETHTVFPGDRGCLSIYLLNVTRLAPGEALFVDVNVPHACVSGDFIEIQACSDNIIRGGFSKKFCDVTTLINMADYTSERALHPRVTGWDASNVNGVKISRFSTPYPDFGMTKYLVTAGVNTFDLGAMGSGSVCIVIEGCGKLGCHDNQRTLDLKTGTVFFLAAESRASVDVASSPNGMLLFRGHAGIGL